MKKPKPQPVVEQDEPDGLYEGQPHQDDVAQMKQWAEETADDIRQGKTTLRQAKEFWSPAIIGMVEQILRKK